MKVFAAPAKECQTQVRIMNYALALVALFFLLAVLVPIVTHSGNDRHCWVYDSGGEPEYYDYTKPGCTAGKK